SALANFLTTLSLSGSNFSASFPAYSMTVLDLSGSATGTTGHGPSFVTAAAAAPNPVTATPAALTAPASHPAGQFSLNYTWSVQGTAPGAVTFSANGTNAAASTVATFSHAGTYTIQVQATDPGGLSATSTVTVVVNQTASSVVVSPVTARIVPGG